MGKFNADGIVIKTSVTGESDRIVSVLTKEHGIIRAFAKGARGSKSRLLSGTSLFAYCSFTFFEKNGIFHINEAEIKEVFFDLRNSIESLTLAQYFCEVMLKTVPDESSDEEYLRLLLNCLHFICTGKKPQLLIKSVFELRIAAVSGYMPELIGCDECGTYETPVMFFDCFSGKLFCSSCAENKTASAVPLAVVSAMRHIVFSQFNNIFSFELTEELLPILNNLTEKYEENVFQQTFKLLEYYRSVK